MADSQLTTSFDQSEASRYSDDSSDGNMFTLKGESKEETQARIRKEKRRAHNAQNREKLNAQQRAWRAANAEKDRERQRAKREADPEKHRAYHRAYDAKNVERIRERRAANEKKTKNRINKKKYGITIDDFDSMMKAQSDRCKACGILFSKIKKFWACVDHDHVTGRVRGLLCRSCNMALGHAHDDIRILRGLVHYLEQDKREQAKEK